MTVTDVPTIAVEDRLEIQELTARYAFYVDTSQIEPLMELWVHDDPVFDETKVGTGRHAGYDAIRGFFLEGVFAVMEGLSHMTSNHILNEVSGDSARGTCSVIVDGDVKGGGSIRATAWYDDVYERVDGRWKFRSRATIPFTKPQLDSLHAAGL